MRASQGRRARQGGGDGFSNGGERRLRRAGGDSFFPRPRRRGGDALANEKWRVVVWRKGAKGLLKARFAALRVRVADGKPQRIGDKGMQSIPKG
jgi:hypothetical protein